MNYVRFESIVYQKAWDKHKLKWMIEHIVNRHCNRPAYIWPSIWCGKTVLKPLACFVPPLYRNPSANVGIAFDKVWIDEVKG